MATLHLGESIVEQPVVATWKNDTGGRTVRTFIGKEAEIIAAGHQLRAAGYETEITSGPKYTLVATTNIDLILDQGETEPEPEPRWQLIPNNFEQSIFECGRPFVLGLDAGTRTRIEAKLKNPQKFSMDFVDWAEFTDMWFDADLIDQQNRAARVYHYKLMGADGKRINSLTLRRSIVVSTDYNLTWSTTNVGKVLSTDVVVANTSVPANVQTLLPVSGFVQEDAYADGYISGATPEEHLMPIPFYYGWLEHHPTYQSVGSNRVEIAQEWVFNKWLVGEDGFYDVVE